MGSTVSTNYYNDQKDNNTTNIVNLSSIIEDTEGYTSNYNYSCYTISTTNTISTTME